MSTYVWQPIGKVSPLELGRARQQLHNAAQWVARFAHSYRAPEIGNRHLDLIRDARDGALVSGDIGNGLAVGLDVADLSLQFREHGSRTPHRIELEGRSPAQVEAWFLVELLHRHVDCDRFSKALPFEIQGLMVGDGVEFSQVALAGELAEIAAWHANAAAVLQQAADGAGRVICSPYRFDLAVVLPVEGRPTAAVRAGFAPGDERLSEPYFYVASAATLEAAAPPDIARIGTMQTRDLVAHALPASQVLASASGAALAREFLRTGIADCRRRLAH